MTARRLAVAVGLVAAMLPVIGGAPAYATGCSSYAAPDPHRPVLRLTESLSADRSTVSGDESVRFMPDKTVHGAVFRLIPNSPRMKAGGALLRVSAASLTVGSSVTHFQPGSNTTTTLTLRVPDAIKAGTAISVHLIYTLRLPRGFDGRVGYNAQGAWWGSGHPLLAWQRGVGWALDPPTSVYGETATSEDAALADLSVTTSVNDATLATGTPGRVEMLPGGRIRRHFSASAVRDVLVTVGRMAIVRRTVQGVRVTTGVLVGVGESANRLLDVVGAAIVDHAARFGPFPYPDLVLPIVPISGGIEYPGAILFGPGQTGDATPSHEVAHEYFYSLVGNNQGRDPWLDEALATFVEGLHRGTAGTYESMSVPNDGYRRVGAPMSYWDQHRSSYYRSVYVQGASAMFKARRAAGAGAFDYAIRCYVNVYAHTIARPSHMASALHSLPAAQNVLRFYGAIP